MMPKDTERAKQYLENLSKSHKGTIPWNKGKKCPQLSECQRGNKNHMFEKTGEKNHFFGRHHTTDVKNTLSEKAKERGSFRGKNNPNYKPKIKKACSICGNSFEIKPSKAEKRMCCSKECYAKRIAIIQKERWGNPELITKIRERQTREKSHFWKGGISFEPYCSKFTKEFKERVRAFFDYACVECGTPQNGKKLPVHHINYDKMMCCNDIKPTFVCLCNSCNIKANFNRPYWEQHFTEMIDGYYQGKCFLSQEEATALQIPRGCLS